MCAPAIVPIAAATGLIASQRKRKNRPTATATITKPTPAPKPTPKPVVKATAPKPAPKPVVKATPKPAPTPVVKPAVPRNDKKLTPTETFRDAPDQPNDLSKPAAPATRQTATTMAKAPLEQAAVPEQKKRRFTKTRGLIGGRRRGTSSLRIASRGTSNLNY